jgi:hypothetical protein
MTEQKRRFILRLVRMQHAIDAAEAAHAEAFDRDCAFDAGEFSGPAVWRAFARDRERIAQRFGFTSFNAAYSAAELVDAIVYAIAHDGLPLPV